MPVDLYIGPPKKRGMAWWQGCFLILLVLVVGWYAIVVILASQGNYVAPVALLPEQYRPTATPLPTPTETAQSHMQKADALYADGQFDAAISEYRIFLSLEPNSDVAYAKIVKPLILVRKYDEAVQAGRRAVQINDQRPENLGALAEALDWHGDYGEAIDFALRATELNPNYALGYAYAAEIYADLNRPDKALPVALKAVQLDDSSSEAHRDLGYVYEATGNYRKAIPEYQRAIQLQPKFAHYYISLARNFRALRNFQDAVSTLQNAIKIDPKNPAPYDELGWTYSLSGDYQRAIAQLKKAIEVDPSYEVPYGHIGHVYFVQQNWQDAVTNLEKAIQNGGTRLEYYYKLGIAYVNLNECVKGKQWVDKAVAVNSVETAVQGAVQWYQQHCEVPTPKKR